MEYPKDASHKTFIALYTQQPQTLHLVGVLIILPI